MDVELHGMTPIVSATAPMMEQQPPAHHRSRPAGHKVQGATAGGATPAPRKRQRTPPSPTPAHATSYLGYQAGEVFPAPEAHHHQQEDMHKRMRASVNSDHVLYHGDHGVLETIATGVMGTTETTDPDIQRAVEEEAMRMKAHREEGTMPLSTDARLSTTGTHFQPQPYAAHVKFAEGVAAGAPAHPGMSPVGSARTASGAGPHGLGAVTAAPMPGADGSDSRSTGSVKRKAGKVQRAPAE